MIMIKISRTHHMIFPLIVFSGLLPLLSAEDTDTDAAKPDYTLSKAPILWIHVFFAGCGLIAALLLLTRLNKFCFLSFLVKRGKPLGCLSHFLTAFCVIFFEFLAYLILFR